MTSLTTCLALASRISHSDSESVLSKLESYRSAGMSASDAQRMAVNDLMAEIDADGAEMRRLVREQHPDLFKAATTRPDPAPVKPRVFSDPAAYVPRQARSNRDLTQTPAFKAWFGSDSTMVNKDGSPMVLYHGTSKSAGKFSSFRRSTYGAMGPAVYLGDSPEASAGYDQGVMMKVYARGKYLTNLQWTDYVNKHGWKGAEEAATKDGWAGVYDEKFENAVAVWDPKNIKSATDNVGTFDESANIRQARAEPTYISRPVTNAKDIHDWAVAQGFKNVVPPEKMHVTVAYSKAPIDASSLTKASPNITVSGDKREVKKLGDDDVPVLRFNSKELDADWQRTIDAGASWDHGHSPGSYQPHVTLSYESQPIPSGMKPYAGPILLGPEKAEPLQTDWSQKQGLSQSKSFAEDMHSQEEWLDSKAKEAGYDNIDHLADNDFDAFMRLAEDWRNEHPMEVAQARSGMIELPAFGAGSIAIEALQDRYNRWKQVINATAKQGGVVTEANDFYAAEERYWGSVASRIEDFDRQVSDLIKAVAADKLTLDDVQLYAYAKHAKERNEAIRKQREANSTTGFDSWSGMTDEEADEILQAAMDEGLEAALERHHATLMGWTQGTRDLLLDEGLITDDQYLALNAAYDNYVPLKGNANKAPAGKGTGSGFNIRGKETQRAKGRYSMADNIIEHIILDRTRALIRAGKNQVLRSFLQFVIDNPSDNLWQINAVERRPVMTTDDQGNQVIEEANAVIKNDQTIGIKDGGREVYVLVKDKALLEQMRNMNVEGVSKAVGLMLMAQRALGRLYTSLNPVFTVLNGARDITASSVGMIQETGFRGAARLMINVPGAMTEAWKAEFGSPSPDYQLFRATGGKTGFMDMKDIDSQVADLKSRLEQAEMSNGDPRKWAPAALSLIEKINAGVENGTRFATFKAARAEGKSLAESARISKNISVNFNRKGTWAPQMGAWFLFFNPAVQGSVRVAQALKSPKVMATVGAGMAGIALLALQNASMGDDDDGVAWWDKIPQETKDRNVIIVLPPSAAAGEAIPGSRTGRYLKIPMPYGWNWFATISNQAVDVFRHRADKARGVSAADAIKNVFTSFMGAYMPVQELSRSFESPKSAVLAGVPDFLNPIAQSLLNVNSFGKPMYPDDQHNKDLADAGKYFAGQAGTLFQRAAQGLNEATGGNKYKSGMLDFTPATIENLVRSYGGGPASFALDLMNAVYVRQSIERPDLDVRRLPFIKQMYGRIDSETDRAMAYDRMNKIDAAVAPVNAARAAKDMDLAKSMAIEGGAMYKLGGALKIVREQLGHLRKEELAIISGKDPEPVKYARLQALDGKKRVILQRLNSAFNDAMREDKPPAE